ncbi:MAG: SH3 domain-containing protein [Coleofasciculus sp. C2-GNP5-27]
MKSLAIIFATITVSASALILPVKAEMVCQVTDPTGSPLNVRDTPNGRVINALKNGREVYIHEVAYDNQGRPWVNVGGYYQGEYRIWGWVFREFISCYER